MGMNSNKTNEYISSARSQRGQSASRDSLNEKSILEGWVQEQRQGNRNKANQYLSLSADINLLDT